MLEKLLRRSARRNSSTYAFLAGLGAVAGLELSRVLFRRSRLFCPDLNPVKSWDPADYGIDPERVDEVWFESADGQLLHGWYCRASEPIASALYCHGNTGNITYFADTVPPMLEAQISIFIFDYRGFGQSSGTPTIKGVIEDTHAAAEEHDRLRPGHLPSILFGYSLGGAIAAQAVRNHPFDGMILQSTFTNLPELTRYVYPNSPLHLIAGGEFDSLAAIQSLEIPILVVHGTEDQTCPSWMGRKLYESCGGTRELCLIEGGQHKNVFTVDAEKVVQSVRRLALRLASSPSPRTVQAARRDRRSRYAVVRAFRRMLRTVRLAANAPAEAVAARRLAEQRIRHDGKQ